MSLGPLVPFLAVSLIASVTGMVHGTGRSDTAFTSWMAIFFIAVVLIAALIINVPFWRSREQQASGQVAASVVRRNARLAALIYTWGAAALFAVYSLSPLWWRHAWQYGAAMAVIAAGIAVYVYWSNKSDPPHRLPLRLTVLHALAAGGGLAYLIGSDKLATIKSDWAANEVFLWGGIGIVVLCLIAGVSQWLAARASKAMA